MNKRSMIALIALSSMVVAVQADNDGKKPHKKEKAAQAKIQKKKAAEKTVCAKCLERAEKEQVKRKAMAQKKQRDMLKRFDMDNDGKLSLQEKQSMQTKLMAERARTEQMQLSEKHRTEKILLTESQKKRQALLKKKQLEERKSEMKREKAAPKKAEDKQPVKKKKPEKKKQPQKKKAEAK
ncbi:hypothetical protein [Pontiella sulfatireligans]|nr:hypothetical protein [Pontiella sulfatireligans]